VQPPPRPTAPPVPKPIISLRPADAILSPFEISVSRCMSSECLQKLLVSSLDLFRNVRQGLRHYQSSRRPGALIGPSKRNVPSTNGLEFGGARMCVRLGAHGKIDEVTHSINSAQVGNVKLSTAAAIGLSSCFISDTSNSASGCIRWYVFPFDRDVSQTAQDVYPILRFFARHVCGIDRIRHTYIRKDLSFEN
jgi:hypothetical protein